MCGWFCNGGVLNFFGFDWLYVLLRCFLGCVCGIICVTYGRVLVLDFRIFVNV